MRSQILAYLVPIFLTTAAMSQAGDSCCSSCCAKQCSKQVTKAVNRCECGDCCRSRPSRKCAVSCASGKCYRNSTTVHKTTCDRVRTRESLVAKDETTEAPTHKCVVEATCVSCGHAHRYAELPAASHPQTLAGLKKQVALPDLYPVTPSLNVLQPINPDQLSMPPLGKPLPAVQAGVSGPSPEVELFVTPTSGARPIPSPAATAPAPAPRVMITPAPAPPAHVGERACGVAPLPRGITAGAYVRALSEITPQRDPEPGRPTADRLLIRGK